MTPHKDFFLDPRPPAPTLPQSPVLSEALQVFNPHAAGVDIGEAEHWVAVPPGRDPQPVRRFGTFTADLDALADWLIDCGVTTVAMESTGVYWIPLFELLEARGVQVLLIDPRQAKRAPGRPKTDRLDCQWLQRLHAYGLLAGAFRPDDQVCVLRAYLRHRQMLLTYAAHHIQHMQKALQQMNLKLTQVVSDVSPQKSVAESPCCSRLPAGGNTGIMACSTRNVPPLEHAALCSKTLTCTASPMNRPANS
jgi:transposase